MTVSDNVNPWQTSLIDLLKNIVRLALWMTLAISLLFAGMFLVWLVARFLWNASHFLARTWLDRSW